MKEIRDALKALVEVADEVATTFNTNQMDDRIKTAQEALEQYSHLDDAGWNPMDTAPKELYIDMWHRDGYRDTCRWTERRLRNMGRIETGWTGQDGTTHRPTDFVAWRYLPDPPTAFQERTKDERTSS